MQTNQSRATQVMKFGALVLAATQVLSGSPVLAQGPRPQRPPETRPWLMDKTLPATERAEMVLKQMTLSEKIKLLHGNGMPNNGQWKMPLVDLGNGGAGSVEGIVRLGLPPIVMDDAAYGVRSSADSGRYSTALPSDLAAASSWNTDAACEYGGVIGRELRDQGFNMTLGGGVDLTRDPRNGRTFEYAGEDPLLAGTMVGNLMKCEQDQHVIGDIKHYAMNDQETGRNIVNVIASKRAMQETDLLAFHIAIDIAKPGAVMCSYNRVNGPYACENPYLLHDVLKGEWKFPGFVLSDWGGTHSTAEALAAGLDQEQPMADFFGPKLQAAAEAGTVPMSQIDDAVRRVLYAEFVSGIVDTPTQKAVPDIERNVGLAQKIEEQSIVLLKNRANILPLKAATVHTIALIGGHADVGMISGGGSAQVDPPGGSAIMPPGQGGPRWQAHIWFPTSPMKALQEAMPNAKISFDAGTDPEAAAKAAKGADIAIVFAYQWTSEGMDVPNMSLPDAQDALIARVSAANPRTIVVLETGTSVTMPWIDNVAGVVEAWYAGSAGHKALANVLMGTVNPSGKLAMTFPKSEADLPHTTIPVLARGDRGQGSSAVNGGTRAANAYSVTYDEGAKVGYKWYEAAHKQVLFPFGFGLSYSSYTYSALTVKGDGNGRIATFSVKNTGTRLGTEIAQVYVTIPDAAGEPFHRLAGWKRVELKPGESKTVAVPIDGRVLAIFQEEKNGWETLTGTYHVGVGGSSAMLPLKAEFEMR